MAIEDAARKRGTRLDASSREAIVRTMDGGATWVAQRSGTPNRLSGVSFVDADKKRKSRRAVSTKGGLDLGWSELGPVAGVARGADEGNDDEDGERGGVSAHGQGA